MSTDRKRQALGKGLGALIPGVEEVSAEGELVSAPVDQVFPNPEQPRRRFDRGSLEELAASIREKGVLQPMLARRVPAGYELIAGERRLRASKLAGLDRVPVLVKKLDREEKLELALIENIQRENLNPIEEAQGYRELMAHRGYTQEQVAGKVGKDRATVANSLRLLALPDFVKDELITGAISTGHARALLAVRDEGAVRSLLGQILRKGLSVREVERAAQRAGRGRATGRSEAVTSPEIASLQRRIERSVGARVRISPGKRGGKIEIRYGSLDELHGIVEKLLKS